MSPMISKQVWPFKKRANNAFFKWIRLDVGTFYRGPALLGLLAAFYLLSSLPFSTCLATDVLAMWRFLSRSQPGDGFVINGYSEFFGGFHFHHVLWSLFPDPACRSARFERPPAPAHRLPPPQEAWPMWQRAHTDVCIHNLLFRVHTGTFVVVISYICSGYFFGIGAAIMAQCAIQGLFNF